MATLLIVGNSEGDRRCDAKCHDAKESECDCVCEGRYHGQGSAGARDLIQQDLAAGRFTAELAHIAQHLTVEALQETLFAQPQGTTVITTNCRGCGFLGDCDGDELCEQCATDPEVVGDYADDEGCPECGAGGRNTNPYAECTC